MGTRVVLGLDIGGANLKAATPDGRAAAVPFPLWKQPDSLPATLAELVARFPDAGELAVTMTGELCDCFPTKRDGVRHILAAVEAAFPGCRIGVWSTAGRFLSVGAANADHMKVAAANWHGLATYAGRFAPEGTAILIDTGSTTTDVIPLVDGAPRPVGRTDPERLRSGELVYTGVRRTPICALLGPAVAAEFFATAHDSHVLLGHLPEEPDNRSTADGRPMTRENARARLSRMLGGDPHLTAEPEALDLARRAFVAQRAAIAGGIRRVVDRLPRPPRAVLLSGSGAFLAGAAWDDGAAVGGPRARVSSLTDRLGPDLSTAACAYAVAVLATEGRPWDS
jgi:(4-(4-[2-(gamma-L-glutamylamino)ethyl]phenoxymethyl)furan-2-yl)methanamine synthase